MVATRRSAPKNGVASRAAAGSRAKPKQKAPPQDEASKIYSDMLLEAGVRPTRQTDHPDGEPPRKRLKRPGHKSERRNPTQPSVPVDQIEAARSIPADDDDSDEDNIEFEDVPIPAPVIQTTEMDTEDEDEDEVFEDVNMMLMPESFDDLTPRKMDVLELNLTAPAAAPKRGPNRKKAINKAERDRRIQIHQTHLLCLLSHVARRNHWCNDSQVQKSLRPLLTAKMIKDLNPPSTKTQYGQTESLKDGIKQVSAMFNLKFKVTERGMRRALWAEEEEHLKNVAKPMRSHALIGRLIAV